MKTAVLFKTHLWNASVEEAFFLCKSNARNSDIFIVYDNSRRNVAIPRHIMDSERLFATTYDQMGELGFEGDDGPSGGFWYNGDYQQNLFTLHHPDYDYICSLESDVGVYNNIDAIFARMADDYVDMVYYPLMAPNHPWTWFEGCRGYYDVERHIHKGLFCISFFSRRASFTIIRRRMEMSALRRRDNLGSWPIGEAVMANEIINGGLHWRHLADYCDHLDFYDWSPAYLSREFDPGSVGRTFVHSLSVLDHKFMQKNFEIEYRALASEDVVRLGLATRRATLIDDFGVDCRLLHSVHMQWEEARWRPHLDSAVARLDAHARDVLGGLNLLKYEHVALNGQIADARTAQIVWALPAWQDEHMLRFSPDDDLRVAAPFAAGDGQIVIGSRDPALADGVVLEWGAMRERFTHRGEIGGMTFYGVSVPSDLMPPERIFRIRAERPVMLAFVSCHQGWWP